tara:strand:- start:3237 stop:3584 length:348 start_codon:yes stop_codon:yes gene_type:complete
MIVEIISRINLKTNNKMKNTVDFYTFRNWFEENRKDNFSSDGLLALWEMLSDYENDTGEQIEFDPIGFCCEYSEYENLEEFHRDYDKETYPDIDTIQDHTILYEFGNESFIIQQF